jgi:two-component system LytT family response regulator
MIRCLIVEDEPLARDLLQDYLNDFPEIEVLGKFKDGFEAFKGIAEFKPDLLFLDIQMPKITGFELLELLDDPPGVIFTTAYDTFAIKAFELHAVDYLLKPFSKERLAKAIQRVSLPGGHSSETRVKISDAMEELMVRDFLKRVVVKTGNKIDVLNVSDITSLSADGDYVRINTEGKSYLKSGTMNYYEKMLDPRAFIRIHRSHLVNIAAINKIEPYQKENYLVFLNGGTKLPASKKGMVVLRKALRI